MRNEPQIRVLHDESRADFRVPSRPRPVRVYLWEPRRPLCEPAPLVVVSHGTGGSRSDMEWLVQPLVEAGFRTIALDHHGNNFVDGYEPEGFLFVWERPRDVTVALDALAREEPIGPVGAVGFSLGGYTVAALAGARVEPRTLKAVLDGEVPLPAVPEFPGLLEALRGKVPQTVVDEATAGAGNDFSDSRVQAVFQVAPAIGELVTHQSLTAIRRPVEIRWGGADAITPFDADTRPYLEGISTVAGGSAGPDVRHEDFFDSEPGGADVRARVAGEAADFFRRHLTGD